MHEAAYVAAHCAAAGRRMINRIPPEQRRIQMPAQKATKPFFNRHRFIVSRKAGGSAELKGGMIFSTVPGRVTAGFSESPSCCLPLIGVLLRGKPLRKDDFCEDDALNWNAGLKTWGLKRPEFFFFRLLALTICVSFYVLRSR